MRDKETKKTKSKYQLRLITIVNIQGNDENDNNKSKNVSKYMKSRHWAEILNKNKLTT